MATYDGVETFYSSIREVGAPLEAIAINAGVWVGGDFARETDLAEELRMINLNVVSTVHLAKRACRDMVARGQGKILITASVAGTMTTPREAVYGASKAFDLSFAASLRNELKEAGVSVTALLPGPTDTEFFERADRADTKVADDRKKNDPADVAKQGFEALMAGKDRVYGATSMVTKLQGLARASCRRASRPSNPGRWQSMAQARAAAKLAREPREGTARRTERSSDSVPCAAGLSFSRRARPAAAVPRMGMQGRVPVTLQSYEHEEVILPIAAAATPRRGRSV